MTEKLGHYVLEERIARGGMGEVWRARGPDGAVVCIKRLDSSLRDDVDFIEMFRDEAALVLDLDHENIVRMFELIDTQDELAQVMEYVDGASLARIRSVAGDDGADVSVGEALQIGVLLCRALHHAHTRTRDGIVGGTHLSIVHRDVSPQNILVDRHGRLKLVDFGIAKAAQRLTRTRAGTLKGKLSYMAPEQARGDPLDHRADQFAAGILIWEMLTGRRLFGGRNELLILEQVQKSDPVPPSTVKKGVPRSVDRAVLRALKWHTGERFHDMAAFERALQACLHEVAPSGQVDLSPLVARTLAHQPEDTAAHALKEGAPTTRVLSGEGGTDTGSGATVTRSELSRSALPPTDPRQHPEHTGQFFQRRVRWAPVLASAAGVLVIAAVFGGAVWFAERDAVVTVAPRGPSPPFVDVASARTSLAGLRAPLQACADPCAGAVLGELVEAKAARLDSVDALRLDRCLAACGVAGAGSWSPPPLAALEAALDGAAAHPCRTELLDDLLDKSPLSIEARAALADDVDRCVHNAADAPRLRAVAKLEAPAWPKKKKRTRPVVFARVLELEKRGKTALAAGEYQRGKELLVEALALDPSRVDDHGLVGQAFRGLGDPSGAGHHLRLWMHARPAEADVERAARYLRRYQQAATLKASPSPSLEERHVRALRLSDDARRDPTQAVRNLEQARALLPDDSKIIIALGDAYLAAGRSDDAKRAFETALGKSSGSTAKGVKERLAKLGS